MKTYTRKPSPRDPKPEPLDLEQVVTALAAFAARSEDLSSDDVFQETSARYRAVEPEQWLQRHPEAGSSWPSWPQASQRTRRVLFVLDGARVVSILYHPAHGSCPFCTRDRLRVGWLNGFSSGRGTARAEDGQGTPAQSHI